MKHLRKILLFLLILALALPLLCACGEEKKAPSSRFDDDEDEDEEAYTDSDDGDDNSFFHDFTQGGNESAPEDTGGTDSSQGTEEVSRGEESGDGNNEESDPGSVGAPEIVDLGGREISILCKERYGFPGDVIPNPEDASSRIDLAKQAVIEQVENDYNVTIYGHVERSITDLVINQAETGIYDYDLILSNAYDAISLASDSALLNLNSVPTLKFTNTWWDQSAVQELSIRGKLFFVCGDLNVYNNMNIQCVLFNKNLKETLNISDDFYQIAKDGDWTLDYFMEICKGITQDCDGMDGINEFDMWACGTERYNIYTHMVGSGITITQKDDGDLPYFTITTKLEATFNHLDKIITFYNSPDVMVADGGKFDNKGYANVWESTIFKAFTEGRELFLICGLSNVTGFREMEDAFGILPIPKSSAEQDRYYHAVSPSYSSYLMLPNGIPGAEELGLVVEALAMHTQELVIPEFYETQLKYRDVRDEESAEMLDLIFATRTFDLGAIYNWGNIMTCYTTMDYYYASRFDSIFDVANAAMEDSLLQLAEYRERLN